MIAGARCETMACCQWMAAGHRQLNRCVVGGDYEAFVDERGQRSLALVRDAPDSG